jgi:hypothetical protein
MDNKIIAKNIEYLFEKGEFKYYGTFAKYIGFPTSTLGNIRNKKHNVNLRVIKKIMDAFPGISLNWLVLGVGPIMLDGTNSILVNKRRISALNKKY